MARLIAVLNQKGGVGKTTSTLALGAAIADRGHRVLLVDLDPQAGLTLASGLEPGELPATIAHSIAAPKTTSLAACFRPLGPSLTLVPASLELAAAEGKLQQAARREYVLAK